MDALFGFLGFARTIGWVYLCAMFLVAAGLFIFNPRYDEAAAESLDEEPETWSERKAA